MARNAAAVDVAAGHDDGIDGVRVLRQLRDVASREAARQAPDLGHRRHAPLGEHGDHIGCDPSGRPPDGLHQVLAEDLSGARPIRRYARAVRMPVRFSTAGPRAAVQGIPASVSAIWTGSSDEFTLDSTAISCASTPPALHAEIAATAVCGSCSRPASSSPRPALAPGRVGRSRPACRRARRAS